MGGLGGRKGKEDHKIIKNNMENCALNTRQELQWGCEG